MTREERIEVVARVVFRYRDPFTAEKSPGDYTPKDVYEAVKFIDMLDALHSTGAQ